MTSIAWDGKHLAADTQVTDGSRKAGYCDKIDPWKEGWATSCGNVSDHTAFMRWLDTKQVWKPAKDFTGLYSDKNGDVWIVARDLLSYKSFVPLGLGSGGISCEVLMLIGYTAEQAVKETMKHDVFTGGKVQVVEIKKKRKKKD